jgi:chromosome segregation ATPase
MKSHFERVRQPPPVPHGNRPAATATCPTPEPKLSSSPSDIFDHENPQVTMRYLRQYLNQVVVENCQLRSLLEQRNAQLSQMQSIINERNRELEALRKSKEEIEQTINRVAQINQNYLDELHTRNREVHDLQAKLNTHPNADSQLQKDYSKLLAKYAKIEGKYNHIREKVHGFADQSFGGVSTLTTNSILDDVKNYVKEIQQKAKLSYDGNGTNRHL